MIVVFFFHLHSHIGRKKKIYKNDWSFKILIGLMKLLKGDIWWFSFKKCRSPFKSSYRVKVWYILNGTDVQLQWEEGRKDLKFLDPGYLTKYDRFSNNFILMRDTDWPKLVPNSFPFEKNKNGLTFSLQTNRRIFCFDHSFHLKLWLLQWTGFSVCLVLVLSTIRLTERNRSRSRRPSSHRRTMK